MRGQNITDARARDTLAAGQDATPERPQPGPVGGQQVHGRCHAGCWPGRDARAQRCAAKQLKGSQRALDIINEAEKLINGATGSYIGNAVDKGAQAFGLPRQAPKNIARLKALEGSLMMAQPRMEGPQSDKDVALYRQMSGQIGDPNVPGRDQDRQHWTRSAACTRSTRAFSQQSPAQVRIGAARAHEGHDARRLPLHWRQPRRPVELGEDLMPAPWEEYAAASAASAKPWEEYAGKDAGKAPEKSLTGQGACWATCSPALCAARAPSAQPSLLRWTLLRVRLVCKTTSSAARIAARQWTAACARWARTRTRSPSRAASWARRSPGLLVLGGVLANGVRVLGATRAAAGLEPIISGVARGLETGGFRVGDLAGTGGTRHALALAQRSAARRLAW
jgi:hypothetical protein